MRPDACSPRREPIRGRRRCGGFSAIAAIAILVILAVLGAFVVSVTGVQSQSSVLDVLGSRAYQAAKAGIEWNAYNILNPENTSAARYTGCDAPSSVNISGLGGGLGDFTVTATCSISVSSPYTEFGNSVWVYTLTATACNLPNAGACPNDSTTNGSYVERQITSVLTTCRLSGGSPC
jgi:MSHA biogenesis protein MshP